MILAEFESYNYTLFPIYIIFYPVPPFVDIHNVHSTHNPPFYTNSVYVLSLFQV